MRESQYIDKIRRTLPAMVYALKLNLPYSSGIADCWYSGTQSDLWVEYKYYDRLPKSINLNSGKKPKLSRLQKEWLRARYEEGRNVVVIVGSPLGGVVLLDLEWEQPIARDEYYKRVMSTEQLAEFIASRVVESSPGRSVSETKQKRSLQRSVRAHDEDRGNWSSPVHT